MTIGQRVFIEDQLSIAARDRFAIIFAVFRAFFEFGPVEPVAILLRHGGIVFLDPALHFFEQFVDQRLLRFHPRFEPGVFRLEVIENVRVVHGRIGLVLEPVIGIGDGDPVMRIAVIALLGCGRGSRLCHVCSFGVLRIKRRGECQRRGR